MRRALVAALLLLSSAASAQMMDPVQMSGVPRADKAVPEGTLTVKVLHGELAAWAAAGTEVHLVGMSSAGEVSHAVAKVNDEGRAEFKGLKTDGSTVYYALTVVGDERLTSDAVILPPKAGVRMMLSGNKKGLPPVDNEVQASNSADPHAGAAKKALPPGEVDLLVRGRLGKDMKATLRALAGGAAPKELPLAGDDDGVTAHFTGVAPGGPYVIEVPINGKTYRSTPFMMTDKAGAQRAILVWDELLVAVQGGAQPEDDKLWFELTLTVANVSSSPIDPGPNGIVLPLPKGFRGAKIREEQSPFRVVDEGIAAPGPVPPGQMSASVQFSLPVHDGRAEVELAAPYGLYQSSIAVVKSGDTVVSATEMGAAPRVARGDDMREFYVVEASVKRGELFRFSVAGMPTVSAWQGWVKIVAGAVVVILAALAFAIALIGRRTPAASRPADAEAHKKELGQRRDRLYAELVSLERLRASERIDASDFDAQRKAIMAKLVLVHRELDDLEGVPAAGGAARVS